MKLFETMLETFVLLEKVRTSDGEGGFITEYRDGAEFDAVAVIDSTMQAKIAESQGVTAVYTITTRSGVNLDYHDVIKRKSDGRVFRITTESGDKTAPRVSSLNISQVSAEKWSVSK